MNRSFLIIASVVFSGAVTAAQPLTPTERAQVAQIASQSEKSCIAGLSAKVGLGDGPFAITQDYVKNYCTCVRNGISTGIDAKFLREGTEDDGRKFIQSVAQDCAVVEFRENLPRQCKLMFERLPPGPSATPGDDDIAAACGCIEKGFASVTGAQLPEVTRQTIQEFEAYKRDHNYEPTLPLSLMGAYKRCLGQVAASKQ